MSVGSLNWTAYCLASNEYGEDKATWAESICKAIGGTSYSPVADAPTWLQILGSGVWTMLWTAFLAFVIAFLLGSLIGIMRTLPNKILSFIVYSCQSFFLFVVIVASFLTFTKFSLFS